MFSLPFISTANAAERFITSPLAVRNLYAPFMRFLDPVPDSALREYSNWDVKLDQHLANVYQLNQSPFDHLAVDMELYVADVTVHKSLSVDMDVSLRLSLLRPFNGVLDSFINDIHRLIQAPSAGRQSRPDNTFAYHLNTRTDTGWQGRNRWELGNVVISLRKQLIAGDGWAIAALASAKLPTASKNRGWGSGKPDTGLGAVASFNSDSWFIHMEGWGIYTFAKDVPGTRWIPTYNFPPPYPTYILGWNYQHYVRGSATFGWKYSDQLAFITQVQGGTSPYDSGMLPLDNPPLLVSLGVQSVTDSGLGWSFEFTENGLSQLTTQDISFTLSLHYPFFD